MRHGGKMKSATRRGNGKSWVRRCDGVTRRDAVRLGVLSGLGLGVSVISVAFTVFMNFLELLVAFLQAYVFTLLASLYFGAALEEHHHAEEHH